MDAMTTFQRVVTAGFLGVAIGCGGGFSVSDGDAGPDAHPDAVADAAADRGDLVDSGPDREAGGMDAVAQDSGVEASPEASAETGTDGGACTDGSTLCSGTNLETCTAGSWVASACPYACAPVGGVASCTGVCVSGAMRCGGNQPETCSTEGAWQASGAACSEATSVCQGGACQACSCGAGVSCFYEVSPPPSTYGTPNPVTVLFLTPDDPSATIVPTITSPPVNEHNPVWYDVDVSAFPSGGTLVVAGQLGASGCTGSSFLTDQCQDFPPSYEVGATNVDAGSAWNFQYTFAAGTDVLHFGTEGSWNSPAGTTNTNTVTLQVQ